MGRSLLASCMDTHCWSSASAPGEVAHQLPRSWEKAGGMSSFSLQFLSGRESSFGVCFFNRNKDDVFLHCVPPYPSHVAFLANTGSFDDLSVPPPLKDSCFWNLSSEFVKL